MPTWDQRLPHLDIADHFSRAKSCYFIKLVDALRALRPQQFAEAMYEPRVLYGAADGDRDFGSDRRGAQSCSAGKRRSMAKKI